MAKPVAFVVAALAVLAAGLLPVCAQEAPPPMRVGVVDLEAVGRKFERKAKEEEALTQWYAQEQQYLRELGKYIFCAAPEWEEVAGILRTPKPDRKKEQADRLKTLLDQSTQREKEYQDLRAKQAGGTLTADEDSRYKLLGEIGSTRDADLNKRIDDLEKELNRRMGQIREELMKPVREAVNKVAADKGFTLVLEKDWVYFGGEDVTDDVVKVLNEMAPPAAAGAAPPAEGEAGGAGGEKPKEGEGGKPAEGGGNQ
jgi:Skp family chaperone for outer membrane proteins